MNKSNPIIYFFSSVSNLSKRYHLVLQQNKIRQKKKMAEDLFGKANDLFVDEKYEDAEKIYNKILESNPQNVNALLKRSATLLKLGRNEGNQFNSNRL